MNRSIPKIVHQIRLGSQQIPDRLIPWMRTMDQVGRGWQYRLWREEDVTDILPAAVMPEVLAEQALGCGMRTDILRYEVLRQCGGVYFDCDFEAIRPVDDLLLPGCLHYGDEYPGQPGTGFLASPAGFEFWEFLLRRIRQSMQSRSEKWWEISDQTGQPAFAVAMSAWLDNWRNPEPFCDASGKEITRLYRARDIVAFHREVLHPYSFEDLTFGTFSSHQYPTARAIHHWGGCSHE